MSDLSKICSDYLRKSFLEKSESKLKASHARELVAAYFGFKSHAALLSSSSFGYPHFNEVEILVPDEILVAARLEKLLELPGYVPGVADIVVPINECLEKECGYQGEFWEGSSIEDYITEQFPQRYDEHLMNDVLSGELASSNSDFSTAFPSYFNIDCEEDGEGFVEYLADGEYVGRHVRDVPYYKNEIEFAVRVTMQRVMANIGYKSLDADFSTNIYAFRAPSFNEEYIKVDETGNIRPSDAFVRDYGGLRLGEDQTEFLRRISNIDRIRKRITLGRANESDVAALAALLGVEDEDEDEDPFGVMEDDE